MRLLHVLMNVLMTADMPLPMQLDMSVKSEASLSGRILRGS
jgi:hypothetical protein